MKRMMVIVFLIIAGAIQAFAEVPCAALACCFSERGKGAARKPPHHMFRPGDAISAYARLSKSSKTRTLTTTWVGTDGKQLRRETIKVHPKAAGYEFMAPDTSRWRQGTYEVTVECGRTKKSSLFVMK